MKTIKITCYFTGNIICDGYISVNDDEYQDTVEKLRNDIPKILRHLQIDDYSSYRFGDLFVTCDNLVACKMVLL